MAVFMEKFGWSYKEYMHGANFVIIDMMLADTPRMLSDKEKESYKKKQKIVKVNTVQEMELQMKKMFGNG